MDVITTSLKDNQDNIDLAKKKVFIDMWNAACEINGKKWGWYDAERDDFLIYPDFRGGEGLHLTYEQAVNTYVNSKTSINKNSAFAFSSIGNSLIALLPLRLGWHEISDLQSLLNNAGKTLRAIALLGTTEAFNTSTMTSMFSGCSALEEVYGAFESIYTSSNTTGMFAGCSALREIQFRSKRINFSVSSSPLLSLASFRYMLSRTDDSVAITITVHKDCYAKMTGDTSNAAAAALTEEEAAQWQQLLADAVAKNITFATA